MRKSVNVSMGTPVIDCCSAAQGETNASNNTTMNTIIVPTIIVPTILASLLGLALIVITCLVVCLCKRRRKQPPFLSPVTYNNPTYDGGSPGPGATPLDNPTYVEKPTNPGVLPLDNPVYMENSSDWSTRESAQYASDEYQDDDSFESDSDDEVAARRMSIPDWQEQEGHRNETATEGLGDPPHYSTLQH